MPHRTLPSSDADTNLGDAPVPRSALDHSAHPADLVLRAALDVSPDGFAIHRVHRDEHGRASSFTLESINPAGAAPHRAGPQDVIGRDLRDLLPDAEATGIPAAFRRAADGEGVQRLRTAFVSDDWSGTMDLVAASVDRDRIVATWRDVTDQVDSQRVLVEAYTRAQAAWDCLYGVLDAVQDAVLLLDVLAPPPDRTVDVRDPGEGATVDTVRVVVRYLNAAAAGLQDRAALIGRDLPVVRPDLADRHVLDLIATAATDRPGVVRHLVVSDHHGGTRASYAASPAAPAGDSGEPFHNTTGRAHVDDAGLGVVLIVKSTT